MRRCLKLYAYEIFISKLDQHYVRIQINIRFDFFKLTFIENVLPYYDNVRK